MSKTATDFPEDDFPRRRYGGGDQPPRYPNIGGFGQRPGFVRITAALLLGLAIVYAGYFWFVRRVVVGPNEVLVLLKKHGSRSLPGDQVIIPRAPDPKNAAAFAEWDKTFGDCNGILEQTYSAGTYFRFSPFDYERFKFDLRSSATIPNDKIGIVVKKFGRKLDDGQVLADPARDQRGPLPVILRPGRYDEYANPFAYEIKQIDPIVIDPGHRGVVTLMAASRSGNPNRYLVEDGQRGVQPGSEPEGFLYVNPFEKRVTPVSIRSHRFEMTGADAIQFPSSDSFNIKLDGFVEWSVVPDKLPLVYTQYGEGNELIHHLEEKVILPYARSYSRLVGSQYNARDFISGDTKLRFQQEFESKLSEACAKQGIEVLQALVRDIEPPNQIKDPINEREVAKQQILSLERQIQVAGSQAQLATQEQTADQNQKIGEANKDVVSIVKRAEQQRDVAVTQARQGLAVAKLRLEAAQQEADAVVAKGQAEANVVLLNKQAEAEPLRQQVEAFGDGTNYARYFFYQQVAPSMKTILTNSDGVFADVFKQFGAPAANASEPPKSKNAVTGVQP
ncbi:MAG TPA: SPFH domain-containing protein [Tepidisphaeraceae bacterium]|nr:SPFH domain-containing protein [Tepidisphaeraceae bacterium]